VSRYWFGLTNANEHVIVFELSVLLHGTDTGEPFFRIIGRHVGLERVESIVLISVGGTTVRHNSEFMFAIRADYSIDKRPVWTHKTVAATSRHRTDFFVVAAVY
jgi:hypothetical protein